MLDRDRIAAARSLLFVPGDRSDRFDKARSSGADAVVLDLEDGTPVDRRAEARRDVVSWLDAGNDAVVRVNPVDTDAYREDVEALRARSPAPTVVMLPKAELGVDLLRVLDDLPAGTVVVPLIETAAGVLGLEEMCAVDGMVRVAFGNVDMGAELGVDPAEHEAFVHLRSTLVLVSAALGRSAPIDGVSTRVEDQDQLVADASYARKIGFTGKLCIHPCQVRPVNEAFTPDESRVAWATRVVEQATSGGAQVVDGEMVDAPVLRRAHAILKAAGGTARECTASA